MKTTLLMKPCHQDNSEHGKAEKMRLGVEQVNDMNFLCNGQVETKERQRKSQGSSTGDAVIFRRTGLTFWTKTLSFFNVDTVVVQRSQFAHNTDGERQGNAVRQL